ncbi:Inner membrane protein YpjD [Zhongshania aliphaticivorans]|uniref:Inner membrane protein YpjD n=1 Tax=Zhongshania aliphaticivorans TaxID=1470434 RepID=A0A5S9P301_9GAMM|nr:cytochrome c biogenesis protein CcsA [Zhongshania aliphaticivorans]CAA0090176.1 Inner membrane protein YpjD [Zhongshania aliphaticivorans]CAA0097547.1 Inner membrane protein YpjD [Zhongshania aliphaticivorans]
MNLYTSIAAIIFYAIATSMQYRALNRHLSKASLMTGLAASLCHAMAAFTAINTENGMDLGVIQVLSLITWLICLIILFASMHRPLHSLLIPLFPLAAISLIAEIFIPERQQLLQHQPLGVLCHILLSILAYSVLTIAATQAIVLALQDRMLREHHLKGLPSILPPLQTMEAMLFELIWAGFLLLTLAIVTGGIYVDDLLAQHLIHKTVFSVLSWVLLAILLCGRVALGWRGKVAIRWTLWAFACLLLGYLGTKIALSIIV